MTIVQQLDEPESPSDRRLHADLARNTVSTLIHALLGAEADARCGATYGRRSPNRTDSRRGYRHCTLDTAVGRIDVAVPKLRSGSYSPDWLRHPEHTERLLVAAVETWRRDGVSEADLTELIQALGMAIMPPAQVRAIIEQLDVVATTASAAPDLEPEPVVTIVEPVITLPAPVVTIVEPVITLPTPVMTIVEPVITLAAPVITLAAPVVTPAAPVAPAAQAAEPAIAGRASRIRALCRRRPLLVSGWAILLLLGLLVIGSLVAAGGRDPLELDAQLMTPALVSVIEMPPHTTRADLLAATCGSLHDDLHRRSDTQVLSLVQGMDREFGARTISRIAGIRRVNDHTAHALVGAQAESGDAPARQVGAVDVEFDTSTTPWKICYVGPTSH